MGKGAAGGRAALGRRIVAGAGRRRRALIALALLGAGPLACGRGGDVAVAPPPTADVRPTTTVAPTTTTTVPPTTVPPTTTTLPPTTTTTAPPPQTYVVVAGDTLVGIADRFGVGAQQITLVNRLSDPRRLTVGQTLLIPVAPGGSPPSSG